MMIIHSFKQWLAICLLLLLPIMAHAAIPQWIIVPDESQLAFTGTQNNAPVTGEFKTFTGEIFVNPFDVTVGSIDIVIDMGSLTASYADLKETLVTSDWFDIKRFPKAEFKATQFKKTGNDGYEAAGTLTIRDKSAPVTLIFTSQQIAPNKRIVNGSAVFKRSTFGIGQGEWASTDEIKDAVMVTFQIVAIRKE